MRRTKIVCTIGPASASDKMLEGLIRAGMNVARLNFSHGDYAFHRRVIRKIRQLERKFDRPVAILQDLPGPKIRIGAIAGDHVRLQNRRPIVLTTRNILGTELAANARPDGHTLPRGTTAAETQIASPSLEGLIVLRAPLRGLAWFAETNAVLQGASCAPVKR